MSDRPAGLGIDAELRAMLVCPACRGDLIDVADALRCAVCKLDYPVVHSVPHMVAELARPAAEPG